MRDIYSDVINQNHFGQRYLTARIIFFQTKNHNT